MNRTFSVPIRLTSDYVPFGYVGERIDWRELSITGGAGRELDASHVDLKGARIRNAHWLPKRFRLKDSLVEDVQVLESDIPAAMLDGCEVKRVAFDKTSFDHSEFRACRIRELVGFNSVFQATRFSNCDIESLIFGGRSNLGGLTFHSSSLNVLLALDEPVPPMRLRFVECSGRVILAGSVLPSLINNDSDSVNFYWCEGVEQLVPNLPLRPDRGVTLLRTIAEGFPAEKHGVPLAVAPRTVLGEKQVQDLVTRRA